MPRDCGEASEVTGARGERARLRDGCDIRHRPLHMSARDGGAREPRRRRDSRGRRDDSRGDGREHPGPHRGRVLYSPLGARGEEKGRT